jgi:hypothetical protein
LVVLLVDVHLQPTFRYPSHAGDGSKSEPFEQQFIDEGAFVCVDGLAARILDKLACAITAAETGLVVMGMSVLNDLGRLAAWAVHGAKEKKRLTLHYILSTITIQHYLKMDIANLVIKYLSLRFIICSYW